MAVKPAKKLNLDNTNVSSGTALNPDIDISTYSDKIIDYAERLKAKYGNKYSDGYYLDYAKRIAIKELKGAHKEIYSNMKNNCAVTDSQWANYSYEEIIEMENNGYKIPDEILEWAHAQQQADVTAYVVVADEATTEDYTSTEEATDDNSLDSIKQKAIKYITQAENSIKETEAQEDDFKEKLRNALFVKIRKEDEYKKTAEQVEKMTEEWKDLDEKKKNGTLSSNERLHYKILSQHLSGKNGGIVYDMQRDGAELEEFLSSIDSLNTKIDSNLQISEDVIQAGKELSDFSKNYNDTSNLHVPKGLLAQNSGTLSDILSGITGDEVSKIAIEKGTDLETYSNDLLYTLQNNDSSELKNFATSYVTLAQQTQENVQNTMNGNDKEAAQNPDENQQQDKNAENKAKTNQEQSGYSVNTNFTAVNAIQASVTTIKATTELNSHKTTTNESDKTVKKAITNTNKDMKKLTKEASSTAQKREANLQQAEAFLAELEAVQQESENTSSQNTSAVANNSPTEQNNVPVQMQVQMQAQTQTQNQSTNTENENKTDEMNNIMTQISNIDDQDKQDSESLGEMVSKNTIASAKYQKNAKTLDDQNSELSKRAKNVQKVSEDTMIVGTGTAAVGIVHNTFGSSMLASGIAMMSNPFTYSTGMMLAILGKGLINMGIIESATGAAASVSGATGIVASSSADEKYATSTSTLKSYNNVAKENAQLLKSTQQALGQNTDANAGNNAQAGAVEGNSGQAPVNSTVNNTAQQSMQPQALATANSQNNIQQTVQPQVQNQGNNAETSQVQQPQTQQNTQNQTQNAQYQTAQTANQSTEAQQANNNTANPQEQDNKDSTYSVSIEFNSANALSATSTVAKATQDMNNSQSEVENYNDSVAAQTKKSADIVKTVEKEANQATSNHEENMLQAQALTQEYTAAQSQVQNAQTQEEASAAQVQMQNISIQMETSLSSEEQIATTVNKTVADSIQQLSTFKNSAKSLNQSITSLDKKIANQLDVAQNTLIVGIGTSAVGITNTVLGSNLIATGSAMLSNPFTFQAGIVQVALGQMKLVKGVLETSTGAAATVSAANGLSANNDADNVSSQAEATVKSANANYKDADKKVQAATSLMSENTDTNTDAETDNTGVDATALEQPNQARGEEDQIISSSPEDETVLAASASTNVNINNSNMTDDKEDKRLTRFNNDSIIESKKKKKKVMAVSASARG